ncbi:MAG: hypothetical protein [Ixodes ricinus orinovirus-like virus 1]|uniref:Uncharacterized protein n=1 Tax=Ixodes ricinus orinovirus-like virus 1 TaxID=2950736 RepID=A0AAE9LV13_9MONO|nr:MAG: hypothetical protein [Ixodes ricinus orinovirus-like virus 1]
MTYNTPKQDQPPIPPKPRRRTTMPNDRATPYSAPKSRTRSTRAKSVTKSTDTDLNMTTVTPVMATVEELLEETGAGSSRVDDDAISIPSDPETAPPRCRKEGRNCKGREDRLTIIENKIDQLLAKFDTLAATIEALNVRVQSVEEGRAMQAQTLSRMYPDLTNSAPSGHAAVSSIGGEVSRSAEGYGYYDI